MPDTISTEKDQVCSESCPMQGQQETQGEAIPVQEETNTMRRKEMFGDCRLIEIIHLHDCLRGALGALRKDVGSLTNHVFNGHQRDLVSNLERRVSGRFKVIWSVFRAHSAAEDEFIWPALKKKTDGRIAGSPVPEQSPEEISGENSARVASAPRPDQGGSIVQEEYEEDHADEERMFAEMDTLLVTLRDLIVQTQQNAPLNKSEVINAESSVQIVSVAQELSEHTSKLTQHLLVHLQKEESQCLPLVIKHLSKSEIHDLVGQIMGKRSAATIAQIMTMAVQNLDTEERLEMVKYMKESMSGTFFDRWLTMSGWTGESDESKRSKPASPAAERESKRHRIEDPSSSPAANIVAERDDFLDDSKPTAVSAAVLCASTSAGSTSQDELEKLIRVVATNRSLSAEQKNTTIQGLRDSVWRNNLRVKNEVENNEPTMVNTGVNVPAAASLQRTSCAELSSFNNPKSGNTSQARRTTLPSAYYKKMSTGKVEFIWSAETCTQRPDDGSVPRFSASEIAPTYHDGAAGALLGCPHYSRACKLRHPKSGRLYTCRLCCEQDREIPTKDKDVALDRYSVSEVMCMKCTTLQPAEDRCINNECEAHRKPFAKYFCKICHLYDDSSRPIFHCPYCNTCRLGRGLGIDFRHCMRCNACVSLADEDHHCIPQKLQGTCPICHESLFNSTQALRGLKCGHVMHLSCFTEYRRDHSYTCPLCKVSMEDMSDYFGMLDAAIRMQPMPAAYLSTMSNIYCQDCGTTGQVRFHFVGQKCQSCGSYNTREMGRVHASPTSSP